jgi:hypothetical protein
MKKARRIVTLILCSAFIVAAGKTASHAEGIHGTGVVTGESLTVSDDAVDASEDKMMNSEDKVVSPGGMTVSSAGIDAMEEDAVEEDMVTVSAVGSKLTVGNFIYTVVTSSSENAPGTVKVSGLSETAKVKTSLTVPEKISAGEETFCVTAIGKKAFTTSTALKKVTIKKNVTTIGIKAFQGIKTLETVLLGDGVTTIKKQAFGGCTAIRTITLPTALNLIGIKAFNNCSKLKAVVITSKKLTAVRTSAFNNTKSTRYFVVPSGKKAAYRTLLTSSGITPTIYTF